jgi:hypothetical protein
MKRLARKPARPEFSDNANLSDMISVMNVHNRNGQRPSRIVIFRNRVRRGETQRFGSEL